MSSKLKKDLAQPFESSTGVTITLKAAPALLVQQAVSSVKAPPIPTQEIDGKVVKNELHPDYQKALEEWELKRSMASIDAMVLFSVGLPEGLPKDENWIKQLKYFEKLGHFELNGYDLNDEDDKEFVYKRYMALGKAELDAVGILNGVSQEDIDSFSDTFQSPT